MNISFSACHDVCFYHPSQNSIFPKVVAVSLGLYLLAQQRNIDAKNLQNNLSGYGVYI